MLKIHIRAFKREEWIAHRNFDPIIGLDDNCLTDLINKNVTAAE